MSASHHLPIRISDLLNPNVVENERVEFKESWNPEAVLHTMCAFANDLSNLGGGYIVVGVAEKGGQPVLPPKGLAANAFDAIQKEILQLGNIMQQHYFPQIAFEELQGKNVVVIWCPGGSHRPYQAPSHLHAKDNKTRLYFVRKYSSTVVATGSMLTELISLTAQVPFDDRPHPTATLADLSTNLALGFLDSVGSALAAEVPRLEKRELFERLRVLEGPPERLRVRNIGLLMFNDEPRKFIEYAQIEVAWFPQGPGADTFEEETFSGPLDQQLTKALAYISTKAISEKVVKYPDRAEAGRFWSYPKVALEEALANAVYHRSYEARDPIEVRIFPDRILIHSVNGPDPRITMELLSQGRAMVRQYRNRRIGNFLKELKFTEGRSTGIPKMRAALEKNGSPLPQFHTDDERTYFVTEFLIHPVFVESEPAALETQHVPADLAHVAAHDFSDIELKILIFCQHVPHSNAEILAHVGAHERTGTITRALSTLSSLVLIGLTIPEKPKSKNQKRYTTTQGKAVVEKLNATGRKSDGTREGKRR